MSKAPKRTISLAGIYRAILFMIVPLLVALAFLSISAVRGTGKQVLNTAHSVIESHLSQLRANCTSIQGIAQDLLANNEEIKTLQTSDSQVLRNTANVHLQAQMLKLDEYFQNRFHFFYFDQRDDVFIQSTPANYEYNRFSAIRSSIRAYILENEKQILLSNRRWTVQASSDQLCYCIRIWRSKDGFLGCWIDYDTLCTFFGYEPENLAGGYLALAVNGKIVAGEAAFSRIAGNRAIRPPTTAEFVSLGDYEQATYPFDRGDFYFVFLINVMENFRSLRHLLIAVVVLLLSILGIGMGLLAYIRIHLVRPLRLFVHAFPEKKRKKAGVQVRELSEVNRLFEQAEQQIRDLRISMYEKEMERKQIEMDYLQLQIKPHFFINCISVIYSMAQAGHIAELQKLCMEVAGFLRTLIRRGDHLIPLRDELAHVERYLAINSIRYDNEMKSTVEIDDSLRAYLIPPLMIQTLVENSIKHAMVGYDVMCVSIFAELLENDQEPKLHLIVKDNGPGYPSEVLEILESQGSMETKDGKRTGMENLIKRLDYFYQGKSMIRFANLPSGGAQTELFIPAVKEEENP